MSKLLKNISGKLNEIKGKFGKKSQLALAGILAIIMLIIFFKGINSSSKQENVQVNNSDYIDTTNYVESLETRLESIISCVKGVGDVEVFVMTETSIETVYASNEDTEYEGEKVVSEATEIIFSKDGTASRPVVKVEIYPEIKGVLVVAEGLSDEKLRLMVINAISVALDIENSKIEVLAGGAK